MPQIISRGIDQNKLCSISKEMVDELEGILECPRSYFSIECLNTAFIRDGEVVAGYPFIEIGWFDRGQTIQNKVALVVTKYIRGLGYDNVDVIFRPLDKNRYYENGEHF